MKTKLEKERLQTSLIMILSFFSMLLSSCVNEDMYELYDDDLDGDIIVRNKKTKDDINFGGNSGHRAFNNTCFIISSCHASSSNDNLESYISNLDDFIRNKRSADLSSALGNSNHRTIDDSNREYIVSYIFGTSQTDVRNGATQSEMLDLLSKITGRSYEYVSKNSSSEIKSFISNYQNSTATQQNIWFIHWTKKFDDAQFVIEVNMGNSAHVFNYSSSSSDLKSDPNWCLTQSPSSSYLGVYYPTGNP